MLWMAGFCSFIMEEQGKKYHKNETKIVLRNFARSCLTNEIFERQTVSQSTNETLFQNPA